MFLLHVPAGRKDQKRKRCDYDSDPAEDEDFVPDVEGEEEEMEDEEETEDSDFDFRPGGRGPAAFNINRTYVSSFLTSVVSL